MIPKETIAPATHLASVRLPSCTVRSRRRRRGAIFFLMMRPPPRSTLFPCTTLFRSPRLPPRRPAADPAALQRQALDRVPARVPRGSQEHTSELQSLRHLVCRLLL